VRPVCRAAATRGPSAGTAPPQVLGGDTNAQITVIDGPVVEAEQYPPDADIVVDDPNVEVGGEAAVRGSGCVANETLQVFFDGDPIGTIRSNSQGSFAGSIVIPPGTRPGIHLLTVRGSVCILNVNISVLGSTRRLAFTGSSSNTGTFVLAGTAAVVIGLIMVVGTRRRRRGIRGRSMPPSSTG